MSRFPDWRTIYDQQTIESMPWYYATLDPDVDGVLREWGIAAGRVLDIGTGPGTQALALAARGFAVTGTDLAEGAIRHARAAAQERGLAVDFRIDNVLTSQVDGAFDLVLDRGCFHVFAPDECVAYRAVVARLLRAGGLLVLKTFSDLEPGELGPYRYRPEQIRECFEAGGAFTVLQSRRTVYFGSRDPMPQALLTVLRRAGSAD